MADATDRLIIPPTDTFLFTAKCIRNEGINEEKAN